MQLHDQLAHYPIATQSHPPCQLKILTRRDQLRLKQAKDDEKKEAKAAKKAAKEAKELHQDKKGEADGKTKKPGRKRKTEATDHDDHAEGDTADSEKPKKQAKRLRKAEEKQDDHVCEPEDADMVPEPKAKAKAKAKATAKRGAKSKAENVEKVGEAKAKAASKRKAKAKPVPKDEEPQKDDAEEDSEEDSESEMSVATPKKNLFQESDGESSEESTHDRLVKKMGEFSTRSSRIICYRNGRDQRQLVQSLRLHRQLTLQSRREQPGSSPRQPSALLQRRWQRNAKKLWRTPCVSS